jgi:small-conductance mechanosensitive channel
MNTETIKPRRLEQRVEKLEKEIKLLEEDVRKRIEELEKRITGAIDALQERTLTLETAARTALPQMMDEKADMARSKAVEDARALVDALSAALTGRIDALEASTQQAIEDGVNEARDNAEDVARGLVDALSAEGGALFNLISKHGELSAVVDEIKNPKTPEQIAKDRLPAYRLFSPDQLKAALSKEGQEVLVEIASRLKLDDVVDSQVLSKMIALVKDRSRMAKLVTVAGTKANA